MKLIVLTLFFSAVSRSHFPHRLKRGYSEEQFYALEVVTSCFGYHEERMNRKYFRIIVAHPSLSHLIQVLLELPFVVKE